MLQGRILVSGTTVVRDFCNGRNVPTAMESLEQKKNLYYTCVVKRSIDTLRFVTSTHPAVRAPETKRTAHLVNDPAEAESLPGLDNTSVDKLHDVLADGWVLHVILQRSRV